MSAPAWDLPYHILKAIFTVVKAPKLKFRSPASMVPEAATLLTIVLFTYFFITSGVIYDILQNPPSMGMERDRVTGAVKPVAISARINSQYIFEGFTLGFFFMVGAAGFLLLKFSSEKDLSRQMTYSYTGMGVVAFFVSQKVCEHCLSIKMPNYLRGYYA